MDSPKLERSRCYFTSQSDPSNNMTTLSVSSDTQESGSTSPRLSPRQMRNMENKEFSQILPQISSSGVHRIKTCTINRDPHYQGFGFILNRSQQNMIITSVDSDSPAWKAGVRSKDKIVKINNIPIVNKEYEEIAGIIKNNSEIILELVSFSNLANRRAALSMIDTSTSLDVIDIPLEEEEQLESIAHRKSVPIIELPKMDHKKVPARSNSTRNARPKSLIDTSQHKKPSKKESMLSYFKPTIRKSASNHQLDDNCIDESEDDMDEVDATADPEPVFQKKQGRIFDNDSDPEEEHLIMPLAGYFDKVDRLINSPALTSIYVNSLCQSSKEQKSASLMFYFVVIDYHRTLQQSRELAREEGRKIALEIITTFLLDNSPLRVNVSDTIVQDIFKNMGVQDGLENLFKRAKDAVEEDILQQINEISKLIRTGLSTTFIPDHMLKEVNDKMTREEELNYFERLLRPIVSQMEARIANDPTPLEQATYISLANVHRHFASGDATSHWMGMRLKETDSLSTLSAKFKMGRSMENLSFIAGGGSGLWRTNVQMFNSKTIKKGGMFGRKQKTKNIRGHILVERRLEHVHNCAVCSDLLWGIGPQGYLCQNCEQAVHHKCKNNLKECSRDKKLTRPYFPSKVNSHNTSVDYSTNSLPTKLDSSILATTHEISPPNTPQSLSIASPPSHFFPSSTSPSSAQTSSTSEHQHLNSTPEEGGDTTANSNGSVGPTPGEDSNAENSFVKEMVNRIQDPESPKGIKSSTSRSISELGSFDSASMGHRRDLSSGNIRLADLIIANWQNDPDMQCGSAFEAKTELAAFPKFEMNKNADESKRLLVLLEFHHKIRFLVQYIKSFDYFLLRNWPPRDNADANELFLILCLDCIEPLTTLFKSLASRLDKCRTDHTYSSKFANEILDWMTERNEENMVKWLQLSSRLCAVNALDRVRTSIKTFSRRCPTLENVLNLRHNKFKKVEALSQTRTLLFSLPMIASTVKRTLQKKAIFSDEAKVWASISARCNALPSYMNAICMPLVDHINSNQIINISQDIKYDANEIGGPDMHNFMINFPKSMFDFPVMAHAVITLEELRITPGIGQGKDCQGPCVKPDETALIILYESFFVLLPKEGDRYVFRSFKPQKSSALIKLCSLFLLKSKFHVTTSDSTVGCCLTLVIMAINCVLVRIRFNNKADRSEWETLLGHIRDTKPRPLTMRVLDFLAEKRSEEPTAVPSLPSAHRASVRRPQPKLDPDLEPMATEEEKQHDEIDYTADYEEDDTISRECVDNYIDCVDNLRNSFCQCVSIKPDNLDAVNDLVSQHAPTDPQDFLVSFTPHCITALQRIGTLLHSLTREGQSDDETVAPFSDDILNELEDLVEQQKTALQYYRKHKQRLYPVTSEDDVDGTPTAFQIPTLILTTEEGITPQDFQEPMVLSSDDAIIPLDTSPRLKSGLQDTDVQWESSNDMNEEDQLIRPHTPSVDSLPAVETLKMEDNFFVDSTGNSPTAVKCDSLSMVQTDNIITSDIAESDIAPNPAVDVELCILSTGPDVAQKQNTDEVENRIESELEIVQESNRSSDDVIITSMEQDTALREFAEKIVSDAVLTSQDRLQGHEEIVSDSVITSQDRLQGHEEIVSDVVLTSQDRLQGHEENTELDKGETVAVFPDTLLEQSVSLEP